MLEVLGCWLAHGHRPDDVLELTPDQMHIGALAITTYKTSVVTAYMEPLSQVMESLMPGLKVTKPSVRQGPVGQSGGRSAPKRRVFEEQDNHSGGKTRTVNLGAVKTAEQHESAVMQMQMMGLPFVVRRASAPAQEAPVEPPPSTTPTE